MDKHLAEVAISHLLVAFQNGIVYFPPMARLQVRGSSGNTRGKGPKSYIT